MTCRTLTTADSLHRRHTTNYAPGRQPVASQNPLGYCNSFVYDAAGQTTISINTSEDRSITSCNACDLVTTQQDAIGSTQTLTDQAEVVTDEHHYDAWAKELAATGSTTNPFRWIGRGGMFIVDV